MLRGRETELAVVCPDGFAARLGGEEFLLVLPATQIATAIVGNENRALPQVSDTRVPSTLTSTGFAGNARVFQSSQTSQWPATFIRMLPQ